MKCKIFLPCVIGIHMCVSLVAVEAPDPSSRRESRHRIGRSRPYDVCERRSNAACQDGREQRRTPTTSRENSSRRPLEPPTVQYPIPTFLANPSVLTTNPITLFVSHIEGLRVADVATRSTSANQANAAPAVRRATENATSRRWDNPNPPPRRVTNPGVQSQASQPVQRPPQPMPSTPNTLRPLQETLGRTAASGQLPDLTTPPPPLWQPYLRDLVITLGYREALGAWPHLVTCTSGNFSSEERSLQDIYMEWCRRTLVGFER